MSNVLNAVVSRMGVGGQAASAPVQRLSDADLGSMKSRMTGQNATSTKNALAGLSASMGGTSSPLFALTASRLRAGAGSATAAGMADIEVAENDKVRSLDMQRRGQLLEAEGLENQRGATEANYRAAALAAKASMYGSDRSAQASMHGADQGLAATQYQADANTGLGRYQADAQTGIAKIQAQTTSEGNMLQHLASLYGADTSKSIAGINAGADMYGADRAAEVSRYASDTQAQIANVQASAQTEIANIQARTDLSIADKQKEIARIQTDAQLQAAKLDSDARKYSADTSASASRFGSSAQLDASKYNADQARASRQDQIGGQLEEQRRDQYPGYYNPAAPTSGVSQALGGGGIYRATR